MLGFSARSFRTVLLATGLAGAITGAVAPAPASASTPVPARRARAAAVRDYSLKVGGPGWYTRAYGTLEWTNAGVIVNGTIRDAGPGTGRVTFSAVAGGTAYASETRTVKNGPAPTQLGIRGDYPTVVVRLCKLHAPGAAVRCRNGTYAPPPAG